MRRSITAIGAAMILFAGVPSAMAAPTKNVTDAQFDTAFAAYVQAHPGDWVGAEALVESMGGTLVVTGADGAVKSAEAATAEFRAIDGPGVRAVKPARGEIGIMAWPLNAFTVALGAATSGDRDNTVSLAGGWNFRDDFLGQGAPVDIAAIAANKDCIEWGSYSGWTYRYDGVSTNRDTLRSGGVGDSGPRWNIHDYISNHMSYADHGTVYAVANRSQCTNKRMQAEFVYEGNDGGSVVGVSFGWGFLDVSYSNPGTTMQKSSGAKTILY